ncbi:hypothetical protein [Leucobacter denitrificans]|uniref:ABC transporter permease n=1 Tax=Leucobacter denitrificans TaxID=683042 RepID=A0A7G9S2Q2_9MICO|nr:hypothetical protein [Leucobacter denitrificans]QNN62127.1 hypothetical protein H9L06_07445 [Leucobacter denitrificans]
MIRTLFAQEFRITRKWLFTSVGIALLVALAAFALAMFIGALPLILGVFAIGIITPMVMGILVASYWRTMYGSEGYFTMSLPVRGRTLYAVKVAYGLLAVLVSAVITVLATLAGVLLFYRSLGASSAEVFEEIGKLIDVFGLGVFWFLVVCIVTQLAFTVIAGATIMSVGAEGKFNHLGFGAPVIGAIIFYVIMQIVSFASMLFIPFGLKIDEAGAGPIVAQGMWSDFVASVTNPDAGDPGVIGLGIVPVSIVLAIVLAWWGARSVDRRTSLR